MTHTFKRIRLRAATELTAYYVLPAFLDSSDSRMLSSISGVPTETFCLSLVVPDSLQAEASDHFMKSGCQKRKFPFTLCQVAQFSYICGLPASSSSQVVNEEDKDNPLLDFEDSIDSRNPSYILFPAKEWLVSLPKTYFGTQECYPTLPQLSTSPVSEWLVLEEQYERLRMSLAVLIEYVYEYWDVVKQAEFEERFQLWCSVCHLGDRHSWPRLLGQQSCHRSLRGRSMMIQISSVCIIFTMYILRARESKS